MFFLSPWFLPALAAVAAPLVLHLLNRKKPRVVAWAAMRFLMAGQSRRSRASLMLKDIWLLLLRMAAVAALVLFFARPMLPGGMAAGGAKDVIFVVDASLSTAQESGNGTAWTHGLTMAKQAIATLGPDDFVRVLLATDAPQWLTPSALQAGDEGKTQAISLLESAAPGQGGGKLPVALTEAVLARPAKDDLVRRIVVFTDGQAVTLQPGAAASWAAVRDAAHAMPGGCVMEVVSPAAEGTPLNLAVTRTTVSREQAAPGEMLLFRAHLKNFGPAALGPVSLRWTIDGAPAGLSTVSVLQPGAEASSELSRGCPPGTGTSIVSCELEAPRKDVLPGDNTSAVLVETTTPVPVLLIDGSMARDAKSTDTGWIEAALGGTGDGDSEPSAFAVNVQPVGGLTKQALRASRVVILANPPELNPATIAALEELGGTAAACGYAGEQTHLASAAFRKALYRDGRGLSPLQWTSPKGLAEAAATAVKLRVPPADHPVTKFLHDARRSDAGSVRMYRRFLFDAGMPGETQTLLAAEDGAPFLAEKVFGAGRVLVQGAPFNLLWGDWPKHHAFVVLLYEGLWRLASGGLVRWNLAAGEAIAWPVPQFVSGDSIIMRRPDGRENSARAEMRGRRRTAVFADTAEPGMYVFAPGGVDERQARFLVQRSGDESDLRPATPLERESLAKAGGLIFTSAPLTETAGRQTARHSPAWTLCAALAGVFLCVESLVAAWLLRRRHETSRAPLTLGGAA